MLRALVLVLLLVNAAFYAWTQGWLNGVVGVRPDAQHEAQRLQLQQHADQVLVVAPGNAMPPGRKASSAPAPASEAASAADVAPAASAASEGESVSPQLASGSGNAAAPASSSPAAPASAAVAQAKPPICVEAGPFVAAEWPAAEAEVRRVLPTGHWTTQAVTVAGLWLVYMGPYEADQLERKQAELRRIKGLNFEEVRTPTNLAQGLSLGRYNREDEANLALNQLRNRGIRTARVVSVRAPMAMQILRVPAADEGQQVKLSGLKLPPGKGFVACRG